MPPVTRISDSCTGHDDCPGVPLASGSHNVYANGIPVGRVGDSYSTHACEQHTPHTPVLAGGSGTVYVNGIPVSRIGDGVSCGGSVAAGSPNVIIGG